MAHVARNNRGGQFDQLAEGGSSSSICPIRVVHSLCAMHNRTTITSEMPANSPVQLVYFPLRARALEPHTHTYTHTQTTRAPGSTDVMGRFSPPISKPTRHQAGRLVKPFCHLLFVISGLTSASRDCLLRRAAGPAPPPR